MIFGDTSSRLAEQLAHLSSSVGGILPELVVAGTFCLLVVAELVRKNKRPFLLPYLGIIGLLISGGMAAWLLGTEKYTAGDGDGLFLGMIQEDGMGRYFHLLFDFVAILTLLVSAYSRQLKNQSRSLGEYFIIVLAMVLGLHFMSMASNLLMMYLALEMVSLPSYLLTAYTRLNGKSAEAALKYVIYGSFSSGLMLYGISWLYGITGTLDLTDPAFAVGLGNVGGWPLFFIVLLTLSGFVYKIGALPFHFWAPDVYEGAPYPMAAFFSVAPKAAGFAMLMRFFALIPHEGVLGEPITWTLAILSVATMTFANLVALRQSNFRRLLAYSSIAQAGYILVGVMCFTAFGYAATVFYLTIYLAMSFSAFLMAGWLSENLGIEKVDDVKGLAAGAPILAVLAVLFMVSLTGLPPTAGFIGKLELFLAGFEEFQRNGHPGLMIAMIGMLINTVISLFYYLRIPSRMIFQNSTNKTPVRFRGLVPVISLILAFPVLWLGIIHYDRLINFFATLVMNLNG